MIIQELQKKKLIESPKFLPDNCHYLTIMGSMAYGVAGESSDWDIYGFCIPPKDIVFPHLAGEIFGFGRQIKRFEQWQQHHVVDPQANGGKGQEYDFTIYNIVKFFHLCMENNPNLIDSLFTPQRCVIHSTAISNHVRENRNMFLHKGAWHKFKGYAFAQRGKMLNKGKDSKFLPLLVEFEKNNDLPNSITIENIEEEINERLNSSDSKNSILSKLSLDQLNEYHKLFDSMNKESKRYNDVRTNGYDKKFAYHIIRLLNEIEQILIEHTLDLDRNREQLKSIRRGEWSIDQILNYFESKEKSLEELYTKSSLPHSPNEKFIKNLLLECLEMHYGKLDSNTIVKVDEATQKLNKIREILES